MSSEHAMELEILVEEPRVERHETPIVFVHGMWHSAWCWKGNFLPYFAQAGYRCYAPSLRGHGTSEGRERLMFTRIADYVTDLTEVISELERSPVLVGHSMGGMVVQKYLGSSTAPAAVLLASVPAQGLAGAVLRFASRHPLVFLKGMLSFTLYHMVGTPELCRELLFSSELPEEELQQYAALMENESYRAFLDMIFLDLPCVENVHTPLLVLGAQNDRAIAYDEVVATARAYGTEAELVPNVAHDVMLEPGWRMVADRILTWLGERGL